MKKINLTFSLTVFLFLFSLTQSLADKGLYSDRDKEIAQKNFSRLIEQNARNDALGLSHRNVYVFSLNEETKPFECGDALSYLLCRGNAYLTSETVRALNDKLLDLATNKNGPQIEMYLGLDGKRYKVLDGKKQENPSLTPETYQEIAEEIKGHFSEVFNNSRVTDKSVLLTFSLIDHLFIYDIEKETPGKDKIKRKAFGYILKGPAFSQASVKEPFTASVTMPVSAGQKLHALVDKTAVHLTNFLNAPFKGPGRDFYLAHSEGKSEEELETIKEIAGLYDQMGEILLSDYSDEAWAKQKPYYQAQFDGFGHWGYTYEEYRDHLQAYYDEFQAVRSELETVEDQHRAVVLLKALSDKQMQTLSREIRINALKALVSEGMYGKWNLMGENEETLALRLIRTLPNDRDYIFHILNELLKPHTVGSETLSLLEFLNKRFNDLEYFAGDGNYGFLALILGEKYLTVKANQGKEALIAEAHDKNNVFRWKDNVFGKDQYSGSLENGNLFITYNKAVGTRQQWVNNYTTQEVTIYDTYEYVMQPFDLVAIILEDDLPVLNAKKNDVLFVPAFTMSYLVQDKFNEKVTFCINLGVDLISLAFGVGEIKSGLKGLQLAVAVIDVAVTSTDIAMQLMQENIKEAYGQQGEEFVNSWQVISSVISFANLGAENVGKIMNFLPEDINKVRGFWAANKNDPKLKSILGEENHTKTDLLVKGLEAAYRESDHGHKLSNLAGALSSKIDNWYKDAKDAVKALNGSIIYSSPPGAWVNFAFFWTIKQTKDATKAAYRAAFKGEFKKVIYQEEIVDASFDQAKRLKAKVDAEMYDKLTTHPVHPGWLADVLDKGVDPYKLDKVLGELLVSAGEGKTALLARLKGWDATTLNKLADDLGDTDFAKLIRDNPEFCDPWEMVFSSRKNNAPLLRKNQAVLQSLTDLKNSDQLSSFVTSIRSLSGNGVTYKNSREVINKFLKLHGEASTGIKPLANELDNFKHFIDNHTGVTNAGVYIQEMLQTPKKFKGGAYGLDLLNNRPPVLKGLTLQSFEEGLDDLFSNRMDMLFDVGGGIKLKVETKNYQKLSFYVQTKGKTLPISEMESFVNQFNAYISKSESLNEIAYFFKARGEVTEAAVKQEFQKIFRKKADEWFKPEKQGGLPSTQLESLFGTNKSSEFLELVEELDESIFEFINVQ